MGKLKCYIAYIGNNFYIALSDNPDKYFDILNEIPMDSYKEASFYKDMINKLIE